MKNDMYLDIAIITTEPTELQCLNKKIDSALKLEGLNWGASRIFILNTDPSMLNVTQKFHRTEFAGIVWAKDIKQLYSCTYFLYASSIKDRHKFNALKKKFKNLKRSKFLNLSDTNLS
jgi:hypothetical protein